MLSPKAIKLLRRVQKRILAEPRQFEMRNWFRTNKAEIPNCGTAGCIGGWVLSLARKQKPVTIACKIEPTGYVGPTGQGLAEVGEKAGKILGLNKEQEDALFGVNSWPSQFSQDLNNASFDRLLPEERTKRASDRIDFFIKTNGTDKE